MGRLWSGAIGQGGSVAVEEDVMDAMVLDFLMGGRIVRVMDGAIFSS